MHRWLVPLLLLFVSISSIFGQEGTVAVPRTVRLNATPSDAPFKIIRVLLSGAQVEPGVAFRAGDGWFNRLEVVIENVSKKNIVYAAGQLRFPETGDATAGHLAIMDRISIGRRPEHARSADHPSRRNPVGLQAHIDGAEILVRPGQEIAVPVVDPFDRIQAAIKGREALSTVTTCEIALNQLYFDDGTSWLSGMYFRADPSRPGKYNRISKKEFDGTDAKASQ